MKGALIRTFMVIPLHTIPKKECFTCNSVVKTKINFLLLEKIIDCFFKFFTKCKGEKTQGYFSVSLMRLNLREIIEMHFSRAHDVRGMHQGQSGLF